MTTLAEKLHNSATHRQDGPDSNCPVCTPAILERSAKQGIPSDPERMNKSRARWAHKAILAFEQATGAERENALPDLLCDLMHWSDRHGNDFESQLAKARLCYAEETQTDGDEFHLA